MKVKQQKPSSTSPFPRSDASTLRGGRRVRDVARWGNPGGLGGMDGVQYIMVLFVPRLGPKTWDFMISCFFCLIWIFAEQNVGWMESSYIYILFVLSVHIISREGLIEDEESNLDFLDTTTEPRSARAIGCNLKVAQDGHSGGVWVLRLDFWR